MVEIPRQSQTPVIDDLGNTIKYLLSGSIFHQASVTLTNAQFLATWDAPHLLVPAQGVNKLILPTSVIFISAFVGSYTGDNQGGEIVVEYSSGGGTVAALTNIGAPPSDPDIPFHEFLIKTNATERYYTLLVVPRMLKAVNSTDILTYTIAITASNNTNKALVLELFNNLSGGHASNTLTVTVLYTVLDVTTGLFV